MLAKGMFFGGIVLALIIIVENFAIKSGKAILFLIPNFPAGYVITASIIIGIMIGYGGKVYLSEDQDSFDDY